jgi:hypothetical protein
LFPLRHFQIGETFNNTKPLSDEQLKRPLANLSTTLTSSLPTDLFGQNLAQSRNNNYDTDTSYLNHLTLYYKRLGPKQKNYSEFKASPLLYKPPNFKANQFTPINQKLIKENNSAKKISIIRTVYIRKLGILSQLGFICIVSIFLTIFQNEYKEEVLNYIKAFPI